VTDHGGGGGGGGGGDGGSDGDGGGAVSRNSCLQIEKHFPNQALLYWCQYPQSFQICTKYASHSFKRLLC